ncbi:unnamed protein product [Prorocentrum cordatum]|uniref:Uncharacterized protein n=1 Tax=Prorocentrum cordatum TaxID=2364126 RepID=A0ABN9QG91_9DINO|nr:unnamed protein product [Polarella glacialis]
MLQSACAGGAREREAPALPAPVGPQDQLDRMSGCLRPLTRYDAGEPASWREGIEARGGWSLAEDVPGRPGWISTRVGSTISFRVRFGHRAVLSLGYLRSYEGVGSATVEAYGARSNLRQSSPVKTLDGAWADRISNPVTYVAFEGWDPPIQNFRTAHEKAEVDVYEAIVKFTHASGPKFKVISVISC